MAWWAKHLSPEPEDLSSSPQNRKQSERKQPGSASTCRAVQAETGGRLQLMGQTVCSSWANVVSYRFSGRPYFKEQGGGLAVVMLTFDRSTWEAEAGKQMSMNSQPAGPI